MSEFRLRDLVVAQNGVRAVFIPPDKPDTRLYKPVLFWAILEQNGQQEVVGLVQSTRKAFEPVTEYGDAFVGYLMPGE